MSLDRRANPYRALHRTVMVPGTGPVVVVDLVGRSWDDLERTVAERSGRSERLVVLTDRPEMHRARGVGCIVEYVPGSSPERVVARLAELVRLYAADRVESTRIERDAIARAPVVSGTFARVPLKRLAPVGAATVLGLAVASVLSVVYGWSDAVTAVLLIALIIVIGLGAAFVLRKVIGLLVSIQRYARLSSERSAALRPSVSKLSASVQEYARLTRGRVAPGRANHANDRGIADGAQLVLALGDAADDPGLHRFAAASPRGQVLVITDRDDVVPALARHASVEFLPIAELSVATAIARVVSRVTEIAVESSSEVIVVWPDHEGPVKVRTADIDRLAVLGGAPLRALLQSDTGVRDRLAQQDRLLDTVERFAQQVGATGSTQLDDVAKRVAALQKAVDRLDRVADKRSRDAVKEIGTNLDAVYRQLESLIAMYRQIDGDLAVPHLRGWAVSPDLALDLVERVLRGQCRTVLEAGSGTSTVLFAMAMEHVGAGHVTALEHDESYVAGTIELLERHGVAHRATVHHAPLVDVEVEGSPYRWYDLRGLALPNDVDLLFVDGPPEATGPLSRFPALPLLSDRLADRAEVVLDDGRRADETEIVRLWSARDDVAGHRTLPHERAPWLIDFDRTAAGQDAADDSSTG
jgi:hypothetical protein